MLFEVEHDYTETLRILLDAVRDRPQTSST